LRADTFAGMQHDLLPLVDAAIKAAFAAGRGILEVYGTEFTSEQKADKSPLTEADKRAHAAIVSALADTGLPVLSEEGKESAMAERQGWERYWLVDPLDGTKEFIKRNGEFTVNIALMERDGQPAGALGSARPIAGVLFVPVKDTLYFSWQGGGAYRQSAATHSTGGAYERALSADRLPVQQPRSAFTIVASRSHPSPETEAYIARMEQEHGAVALTSMGSALKICLVAEGAADAYPRYAPTMEWDTAAGHAIANEAGKQLIDITTGAPMRYNKASLVNNWFIVN
jgi:3'(2'), 5'-bisphosphate nucleotidase